MVLKACYDRKRHMRGNKLTKQVKKSFYWNDLRKDCKRYIKTCQQYQTNKNDKTKPVGMLHLLPIPNCP
jgi:Integrase zinc binding domain